MGGSPGDVTLLLREMAKGDPCAEQQLFPLIYRELRRVAAGYMRRERPDHTLQPTALGHEAYLRLIHKHETNWDNRNHFFAVAAQIMRRILVDHARARLRAKRGGNHHYRVLPGEDIAMSPGQSEDIVALNESLLRLAKIDSRQARVVELRFFAGLSIDPIAKILSVSPATVKRDWNHARAWLYEDIRGSRSHDSRQVGESERAV
jgi:RNA polymerase sigma-70 factor, ECF subfamily